MARKNASFRTFQNVDAMVATMRSYPEKAKEVGARAVVEAAELGAERMVQGINTSGTGWMDRAGRVDTGKMRGAVDHDRKSSWGSTGSGTATRSASFGFLNEWEPYFLYQEEGFANLNKQQSSRDGGPPGYTLPMNAFYDAYLASREAFIESIRNANIR